MSGDKVRQRVWPILAPKKYSDTALQGISIHRPIIYGNSAVLLSDEEKERAPKDHTHRWTVAVRSPAPGRDADTVGGGDDLSYFIKKVSFKLHDTYPNPTRTIDKPPFEVSETGWGEFDIQIRIIFVSESAEKPLSFYHHLKLHPWPAVPSLEAENPDPPVPVDRPDPVHSWQYDEIVFHEPFLAFFNLLLSHPPTPLPKVSKRGVGIGVSANAFLTGKGTPEFAQSMEKEENERLESARKRLIEEADRLRAQLIVRENELQRLKQELEQ